VVSFQWSAFCDQGDRGAGGFAPVITPVAPLSLRGEQRDGIATARLSSGLAMTAGVGEGRRVTRWNVSRLAMTGFVGSRDDSGGG